MKSFTFRYIRLIKKFSLIFSLILRFFKPRPQYRLLMKITQKLYQAPYGASLSSKTLQLSCRKFNKRNNADV